MTLRGFVKRSGLVVVVVALWATGICASFAVLLSYKERPGAPSTSVPGAARWPQGSALSLATDKHTLVVLAHPMCPCTRATIDELARLMARLEDRVDATVLLTLPASAPEEWRRSTLAQQAARIPGVHVRWDEGAKETNESFTTFTSGQTLLYAPSGELLFAGGITPSRGHQGDNVGSEVILATVIDGKAVQRTSAVYGCATNGEATK
jgi:hypothetical protein